MIGLNPIFIVNDEKLNSDEKVLLSILIDKDLRGELKAPIETSILTKKLVTGLRSLVRHSDTLRDRGLIYYSQSKGYYDVSGETPIKVLMFKYEVRRKNINNFFGITLYDSQRLSEQARKVYRPRPIVEKEEDISKTLNSLMDEREKYLGNKN